MTRTTNARIAGFTFLAYIAAGIAYMVLFRRAAAGEGIAARLATLAAHADDLGILVLLALGQCFSAIVLAVTLYALTRDEDSDLALLGLVCRLAEGIIGAVSIPATLTLFWLATQGEGAPDSTAGHALAAYLLRDDAVLTATFFAVGSTAFTYLLLRGRMIPIPLAWLGLLASALLVLALPLRLAGWVPDSLAMIIWLPMLAFEVPLGLWLLTQGLATPSRRRGSEA
jgi:hypothetical protein